MLFYKQSKSYGIDLNINMLILQQLQIIQQLQALLTYNTHVSVTPPPSIFSVPNQHVVNNFTQPPLLQVSNHLNEVCIPPTIFSIPKTQ